MPPSLSETKSEPIKYIGEKQTDPNYHHGSLRHAVGVHRYQALRANREYPPEIGSRTGWTYNHQPYLCYWNDKFYLQYLSNQFTEHLTPGRTLLMTSRDGKDWSHPEIIFPEYSLPEINYTHPETGKVYNLPAGTKAVMHQRMGFYVASDNRLLTLAFYSYCPTTRIGPNNGQGLGRVVREIFKNGTYGPIYFIRYNRHAGWNESNTNYPFYKESNDAGFVAACDELLSNKLITLQWWEEDRADDGFYSIEPGDVQPKAFNYFRRPDGVIVGIWKHQLTALSADEGKSWTDFALAKSLNTCGAKVWGQQTEDGRYALVYDHSATRRNRFPLVIMTSDNGYEFDNMLCVHGEVPPPRYYGFAFNTGPAYIRGIMEGNGNPPDDKLWLTYSLSKQDLWVTTVSLPVTGIVDADVNQNFENLKSESDLELWNLYVPQWAPIEIISIPGTNNHVLQLTDEDPYDYASAERHFPQSGKATIEFDVFIKDLGKDILEFELHNENDERALRLRFDPSLEGINFDLGANDPWPVQIVINKWYNVKIGFDCEKGVYDFWLNGTLIHEGINFDIDTPALERMIFRTGSWRSDVRAIILEGQPETPGLDSETLPFAGSKVPMSRFWIDNVKTISE
ncbi:MAG: hypothetical protein A2V66_17645 [Ignavibacteria bacterium RBG_13_36_8]|nr:MAG: hypothetical protein A2V66_17645 [Ignavibacteria bacterium RBG_13_36_8]